ncbi:hypothetical protein JCM17380_15260 [Desulfosporosinus burensis]
MKNKNYLKLLIDIVMSLTFVLLFNKMVLGGLHFHEIAGIGIGLGVLVHIALNFQWVKKVSLRLFDRKLPRKIRLGYLLNILLLISMLFIIVSGLFISKIVFPNLRIGNEMWFKVSHISISYLTVILIGIHIGLHWKWVICNFKKLFNIKSSKVTGIIAKLAMAILLLFGSYQMVTTNFAARIESIGAVFNITTSQTPPAGFEQRPERKSQTPPVGLKQRPEGNGPDNHTPLDGNLGPDRSDEGEPKGEFQSPNPLGVITTYFGIMSVFVILTYYIEKIWTRRKGCLNYFTKP